MEVPIGGADAHAKTRQAKWTATTKAHAGCRGKNRIKRRGKCNMAAWRRSGRQTGAAAWKRRGAPMDNDELVFIIGSSMAQA